MSLHTALIQLIPWAQHLLDCNSSSYITLINLMVSCQCNCCLMVLSVLQAVLAAVNHNIAAADLLLREMEQHQAPSGSDSDEESANHIISPETSATEPAGEQQALKRSGQHQPPPTTSKAPAPPTTSASSKTCNKQSVDEGSADEDLYYKHRKEALKLSKAWRKKLHQAANAFAGSHYSGETALYPTLQLKSGLSCLGIIVPSCLK